jgi:hypothetical protein
MRPWPLCIVHQCVDGGSYCNWQHTHHCVHCRPWHVGTTAHRQKAASIPQQALHKVVEPPSPQLRMSSTTHFSMNFLTTLVTSTRSVSGDVGPWGTGPARRPSSSYSWPVAAVANFATETSPHLCAKQRDRHVLCSGGPCLAGYSTYNSNTLVRTSCWTGNQDQDQLDTILHKSTSSMSCVVPHVADLYPHHRAPRSR